MSHTIRRLGAVPSSALRYLTMGSFAAAHILTHWNSVSLTYTKEWAIGLYSGSSPFDIAARPNVPNPILTARDVTDVRASAVADPFMIRSAKEWYMFFEVIREDTGHGDIGLATSHDGLAWQYRQIVLSESFHLSYPLICESKGELFMIPETSWTDSVRLYKAEEFPYGWTFHQTLMTQKGVTDATPFFYQDTWWMFTSIPSHDTLKLFYSRDLTGPWHEHPHSPIVKGNRRTARPGGRPVMFDDRVFRCAQDAFPTYGTALRVFEILELSRTTYREHEVSAQPILRGTGKGWNMAGMHHVDFHLIEGDLWIAAVDGFTRRLAIECRF